MKLIIQLPDRTLELTIEEAETVFEELGKVLARVPVPPTAPAPAPTSPPTAGPLGPYRPVEGSPPGFYVPWPPPSYPPSPYRPGWNPLDPWPTWC